MSCTMYTDTHTHAMPDKFGGSVSIVASPDLETSGLQTCGQDFSHQLPSYLILFSLLLGVRVAYLVSCKSKAAKLILIGGKRFGVTYKFSDRQSRDLIFYRSHCEKHTNLCFPLKSSSSSVSEIILTFDLCIFRPF